MSRGWISVPVPVGVMGMVITGPSVMTERVILTEPCMYSRKKRKVDLLLMSQDVAVGGSPFTTFSCLRSSGKGPILVALGRTVRRRILRIEDLLAR